ncbi:MAG TPA: hypothetical protein PKK43_17430, partial [Spirochaetota bacterium]|nr:hypothetical protein [Spirochaetota bacterium]
MFDKKSKSLKETIFQTSLVFSLIATGLNICSIYTIENAARVPLLLNVSLNTFYYFAVAAMTTMVSITTYFTMFEGRYSEPRLKTAITISLSYFFAEVVIVFINL